MEFNIPTSKEEMLTILKDIFLYYRKQREVFVEEEMEELLIERLEFELKTDEELRDLAVLALKPSFTQRIEDYKKEIADATSDLLDQIEGLKKEKKSLIEGIDLAYATANEKLKTTLIKNGTALMSSLEKEKSNNLKEKQIEIAKIESQTAGKILILQEKIQRLNDKLALAETNFTKIEEEEILAKIQSLKEDEQTKEREIKKYNSSLHEKEVKYRNSYAKMKADLKFKYASLAQVELSKSQLIEMGYYKDVLHCTALYYNGLAPADAYNDILNDKEVMVYLEEYYEPFLYTYQLRAGM